MSVLRNIESKLESLFEGVFGRAFRTNVQPVELARKLVKEMDDHRNVSVSRVYVPNEYTVYLSPGDREQFSSYEENLTDELQDYLAEHARRENYVVLSSPRVRPEPEPGATMVYKPAQQPTEAASPVDLGVQREVAYLQWDGEKREVSKRRVVIGRSKDCDIHVADPNVSRRHAEVRQEGATYWLIDLDSTNGVEIRGKRVKRLKLEDGTRFTIGSTEIRFDREQV